MTTVLIVAAAVLFIADAWLKKSLMSAGLACLTLGAFLLPQLRGG